MDRQISCMLVTLDILPRMRACSVLCRLRNGMVGHVNVSYFSHSRELVTVRGWIVRACLAKRNSALFSNSAILSSRYLEKERVRRPTQSWTREQKKKRQNSVGQSEINPLREDFFSLRSGQRSSSQLVGSPLP
ncbi:hypothetical protein BJV77DRAFT_782917 [Russula vinacea]|nr:hypothetical protein BJV77DRAFT_782917 [Russula vinacea]